MVIDHLLGEEPELHVGAGEHGLPHKPTKPENKGNNEKDNNTSYAGSCNAPSESGGEEEGTLKRQEQAEDREPSVMDCVQEEQSSMEGMEQTRVRPIHKKMSVKGQNNCDFQLMGPINQVEGAKYTPCWASGPPLKPQYIVKYAS